MVETFPLLGACVSAAILAADPSSEVISRLENRLSEYGLHWKSRQIESKYLDCLMYLLYVARKKEVERDGL